MVAEDGKIYMAILHGHAYWQFTKLDLPVWNEDDIYVVDIQIFIRNRKSAGFLMGNRLLRRIMKQI
jgi:hypothetical protein